MKQAASCDSFRGVDYAKKKKKKIAPPHEQVAFIRLKRIIYDEFVQLREFGESNLEHLFQKIKIKKKSSKSFQKCSCTRLIDFWWYLIVIM